jgi:two-component system, NarL family, response regulator NreC
MRRTYKEQAGQLPFRRTRLRVILADDQTILRCGLRSILDAEPDLEVIGEARDVQGALALSLRLLPDVVITDVFFPNAAGFRAISQLRRECAGVRVLLLTGHSCQECRRAAMNAGAHAYIDKASPLEDLLRAIRSDEAEFAHSPLPARALPKRRISGESPGNAQIDAMTARERQVLIGVARGYSNKRIAGNLGRSVKTIEKHRFKMMHRLGLRNAAAATRYALDNGLLYDDDDAQESDPEN